MHFTRLLSSLVVVASTTSASHHSHRSMQHVGIRDMPNTSKRHDGPTHSQTKTRSTSDHKYLTPLTEEFVVNGTAIPEVNFDVGESYAGLMPLSAAANETRSYYFWFFPSENPDAEEEIMIWLNGGPGCSSLEGLLQENGPFIWQYGTFLPVPNPYTWVNLTNVVWVEQPIGTGFSQGPVTATSSEDIAQAFLEFWEQFVNTFGLQNRKIYITGESYAGYYVPYIADAMLSKNDTQYGDVEGVMIYDPSTSYDQIQREIPAVQFVDYWGGLFPFNDSYVEFIHNMSDSCGYTDYIDQYLVYPASGVQPTKLPGTGDEGYTTADCETWRNVRNEIFNANPCFDVYQVATTCPELWDVLGFPGSFDYVPEGAGIYFNRTDVQKAINAPIQEWQECRADINVIVDNDDKSLPSGIEVLPRVIERTKRTVIGHGALDMILITNGTLLMIQNMTWNGELGFTSKPTEPFYVPYHDDESLSTLAASGVFGTTHTERGLTWVSVDLSGHMIPQYAPSASYRTVEFLLGRIDSLSSTVPFTTDNFIQPNATLGNGTAPPVKRMKMW